MNKNYKLEATEDTLDGLRGSEYDPEKVQFINFHLLKNEMTHLGHLERILVFLNKFTTEGTE